MGHRNSLSRDSQQPAMPVGISDILQIADVLYARTQRVGRLCNEAAALEEEALRVSSTLRLLASPAHVALVHGRDDALNALRATLERANSFVAELPDGGATWSGAVRLFFGRLSRKEDQMDSCCEELRRCVDNLHLAATLHSAAASHEARLAAIQAAEAQMRAIRSAAVENARNVELLRGLVNARTREILAMTQGQGVVLGEMADGVRALQEMFGRLSLGQTAAASAAEAAHFMELPIPWEHLKFELTDDEPPLRQELGRGGYGNVYRASVSFGQKNYLAARLVLIIHDEGRQIISLNQSNSFSRSALRRARRCKSPSGKCHCSTRR